MRRPAAYTEVKRNLWRFICMWASCAYEARFLLYTDLHVAYVQSTANVCTAETLLRWLINLQNAGCFAKEWQRTYGLRELRKGTLH